MSDENPSTRANKEGHSTTLVNVEIDDQPSHSTVNSTECVNHEFSQASQEGNANRPKATFSNQAGNNEVEFDSFKQLRTVLRLDVDQFEEIRQFLNNQLKKTEEKCQQNVGELVRGKLKVS